MKERISETPLSGMARDVGEVTPLSDEILSRLDLMPYSELLALCRRMNAALGGVGSLSKEDTAEAILMRIAANALRADSINWLPSAREWFDRVRGKATQTVIQATIDAKQVAAAMTTAELEKTLVRLSNEGQLPSGVKLIGGMIEIEGECEPTEDAASQAG